jgi:hypothetical protein
MFGTPCPWPLDPDVVVLPWVWTYLYKIDHVMLEEVKKSCRACNGGTQHGKVVTLYATKADKATKVDRIYYWQPSAQLDLPQEDLPVTVASPAKLKDCMDMGSPIGTKGASNSTWGNDRQHCTSTGSILFLLAGGAIYYWSQLQATVAQSSTEGCD